jgi:hypothetical protein
VNYGTRVSVFLHPKIGDIVLYRDHSPLSAAVRANLNFGLVDSQPAICLVCGSFLGYRYPYRRIGRNQPAAQKKQTDS